TAASPSDGAPARRDDSGISEEQRAKRVKLAQLIASGAITQQTISHELEQAVQKADLTLALDVGSLENTKTEVRATLLFSCSIVGFLVRSSHSPARGRDNVGNVTRVIICRSTKRCRCKCPRASSDGTRRLRRAWAVSRTGC